MDMSNKVIVLIESLLVSRDCGLKSFDCDAFATLKTKHLVGSKNID